MWTAVTHRYAETLCGAEDHVRALLARCSQQHQRHNVGGNAGNDLARFEFGKQRAVVVHFAGGANLLHQYAEHAVEIQHFFGFIDDDVKTKGFGTRANHVKRLRVHVVGDEESVSVFQLAGTLCQRHCFGGGGRFVEQRSRGQIQTGQVEGQRLEVQ